MSENGIKVEIAVLESRGWVKQAWEDTVCVDFTHEDYAAFIRWRRDGEFAVYLLDPALDRPHPNEDPYFACADFVEDTLDAAWIMAEMFPA